MKLERGIPHEVLRLYHELLRREVDILQKTGSRLTANDVMEVCKNLNFAGSTCSMALSFLERDGMIAKLSIDGEELYMTAHGELIRKLVNLALRPTEPIVYEWYLLDPLEEPLPDYTSNKMLDQHLIQEAARFLKRLGVSQRDSMPLAEAVLRGVAEVYPTLSTYQYRMIERMLTEGPLKIPVITAPTGTGKTLIFMLYAIFYTLALREAGLEPPYTLIIYPRKALARDQAEKLIRILYHVNRYLIKRGYKPLTLAMLDGSSLRPEDIREKYNGKVVRDLEVKLGESKKVYCMYDISAADTDYVRCLEMEGDKPARELDYVLYTDVRPTRNFQYRSKPSIIITNFWMLEMHLTRQKSYIYKILVNPRLVVIDEAHAYKGLSLAAVSSIILRYLLMLAYKLDSRCRKAIQESDPTRVFQECVGRAFEHHRVGIVLSSATVTSKSMREDPEGFMNDIKLFTKSLVTPGVVGQLARLNGCDASRDCWFIVEDYKQVLEEARRGESSATRLSIILVLAPRPRRAASTVMQEAILTALTWSEAIRAKRGEPLKFIAFFDSKSELDQVYSWVTDVIVKQRCEHCDHLGLPKGMKTCYRGEGATTTSDIKVIWEEYLESLRSPEGLQGMLLDDTLWLSYLYSTGATQQDIEERAKQLAEKICEKIDKLLRAHHADLPRDMRTAIEREFKEGRADGLLATSTLELGIDVDDVSTVFQLKPPRKAENFIQRIGRAGRKENSYYVTLGVLILSSIDSQYLSRDYARKLLLEYSPEQPTINNEYVILSILWRLGLTVASFLDRRTYKQLFDPWRKSLERAAEEFWQKGGDRLQEIFDKHARLIAGIFHEAYNELLLQDHKSLEQLEEYVHRIADDLVEEQKGRERREQVGKAISCLDEVQNSLKRICDDAEKLIEIEKHYLAITSDYHILKSALKYACDKLGELISWFKMQLDEGSYPPKKLVSKVDEHISTLVQVLNRLKSVIRPEAQNVIRASSQSIKAAKEELKECLKLVYT